MQEKLVKELKVYALVFLFFSLAMHFSNWINQPWEHIMSLPSSPLGVWHPFVITFGIYFVLRILKVIVHFIKNLITKKGKQL